MDIKKIANICQTKFEEKGIDKVAVTVIETSKTELQTEYEEIGLFRDTKSISIDFRIIHESKQANKSFTFSSIEGIDSQVEETIMMAEGAQADEAHSMASNIKSDNKYGLEEADLDKMYSLLKDFLVEKKEKYPEIKDTTNIVFDKVRYISTNNQGVEHQFSNGFYSIVTIYTAVNGNKSSSMNYQFAATTELPERVLDFNNMEEHYQETIEQIEQREFTEKLVCDVILAPDVVGSQLYSIYSEIAGLNLINKTSLFMDKVGEKIISDKISIKATPNNPKLAMKDSIGTEGYIMEEGDIIKDGVLSTLFVNDYVANKTGLTPTRISANICEIASGDTSLEDMIKSIKKGILINRISSGAPNKNKDFAGVVKNSYYIEDGKIQYPIKEVMITANIIEMLNNVEAVSKETLNSGASIVPWIKCSNVNIAGK
jgi:PmbA protein